MESIFKVFSADRLTKDELTEWGLSFCGQPPEWSIHCLRRSSLHL